MEIRLPGIGAVGGTERRKSVSDKDTRDTGPGREHPQPSPVTAANRREESDGGSCHCSQQMGESDRGPRQRRRAGGPHRAGHAFTLSEKGPQQLISREARA